MKSATRRISDPTLLASGPFFPPKPSPNLRFCASGSYFRAIHKLDSPQLVIHRYIWLLISQPFGLFIASLAGSLLLVLFFFSVISTDPPGGWSRSILSRDVGTGGLRPIPLFPSVQLNETESGVLGIIFTLMHFVMHFSCPRYLSNHQGQLKQCSKDINFHIFNTPNFPAI